MLVEVKQHYAFTILDYEPLCEVTSAVSDPECCRCPLFAPENTLLQNLWKARCVGQWKVPAIATFYGWRALHAELVRCLTVVNGTTQSPPHDYENVIAIVDVLDMYRSLAEIARACFGRLGQLLDSDEAREATKVVEVRIMEHALWAFTSNQDDVDLQLVSLSMWVITALYGFCRHGLMRRVTSALPAPE